ncbi:pyridoxal phosphate-dependent transferase [Dipodascopsis tothii]|uniref:pyridoxal phosphate-dependent transferase n=1 Tax=Dipodascopsis tothii TaxID=44089 RepID=UPI0034D012FD
MASPSNKPARTQASLRLAQISSHLQPPSTPKMVSTQAPHSLTLIPGPVEFSDGVLTAMATPSQSHVSPAFVEVFSETLQLLRKLFRSTDPAAQGFVVAGSGTLGWDFVASNLVEPGEDVLVLHTGYFADSFADCIETYGGKPTQLGAPVGGRPSLEAIAAALKEKSYKAVTITQVDTSTGVLSDVKAIAETVKAVSPETLIIVDGVCSVACENIEFDAWGLDLVLTAPQKAIGCPTGLAIFFTSARALATFQARKAPAGSYYASFKRWLPVMEAYEGKKGAYFSTPPVQSIHALRAALLEITSESLDERFAKHAAASDKVKAGIAALGLKQLAPVVEEQAHGMTAAYLPEGIAAAQVLPLMAKRDITIAGGLHKGIATTYIRIGHMGVSALEAGRGDLDKVLAALKESLAELGYSN